MTEEEYYKEKIIEMVNQVNDKNILIKIFTVIKTHLQILGEKRIRKL